MILSELQQYLNERQKVSMSELQQHFRMEAAPLRDMLNRLIRKGRVLREDGKVCKSCHSCAPETIEFYQWVNVDSLLL